MTKIKICGLYRPEDIEYVNQLQPDYAGFIINFPKSHRSIDFATAKSYISSLDKNIQSVCVFVDQSFGYIEKFADFCDIVQLHGNESNADIIRLQQHFPHIEVWKAFKIRALKDIEDAKTCAADKILLDNGYGTGEQFDWNFLTSLSHSYNKPYILAGGINPSNATDAITNYHPYALDVSSGVETEKTKDFNKIKSLIEKVRSVR